MAASSSLGQSSRGTRRLCPLSMASSASRLAPTTPVSPRMVSGGNSLSRYFMIGQLKPQPTEVMARNMSPAGVMCARTAGGFELVMSWVGPLESGGTMPVIAAPGYRRRACRPGLPVASRESRRGKPSRAINSCL